MRFAIVGVGLLVTLAGCGRGFFQGAERAPWRREAEIKCLQSGDVKIGEGAVRIEPIEGPGACGMDFPLKVSALGDGQPLAFADDLQPPGNIPNASRMPRWPVHDPVYTSSAPPARVNGEILRWTPGPPPANAPATGPAGESEAPPMSISPPGGIDADVMRAQSAYPAARVEPQYRYQQRPMPQARAMPSTPSDIPDDAILPGGRRPQPSAPRVKQAYNYPDYTPVPANRAVPALGPMRGPASIPQAALKPPATLSCPIVSALDRWVSKGVQPAALHWFNSPVVVIRQIGAYSCRSMVGAGTNHISEHAFGDALDIAGFTLADGRTITVKDGWHGTPEEQGFLHDVQLYACETFNTVLAPGYNIYHYNHIHVDLMRRASGRTPCRPAPIRGDIVAARARAHYASRHGGALYTGSITRRGRQERDAVAGADGYVDDGGDDDKPLPGSRPQLGAGIPSLLRAPGQSAIRGKGGQAVTY